MTDTTSPDPARAAFDRLLGEIRPRLHRYCARMTGSVIDGEDVVQETLAKAVEAYAGPGRIAQPEAWLFRIAHNAALDFLRRQGRHRTPGAADAPETIADPVDAAANRAIAAASLTAFMRLPVTQRSFVILMDVLGYTIEEIGGMTGSSVPAVKAALHRGRAALRAAAQMPEDHPLPALPQAERARLAAYVERFNARDFDALRALLAEEVRLDLVNRLRLRGKGEVQKYFHQYAQVRTWRFAPGLVDGRFAILAYEAAEPDGKPKYFILLGWESDRLAEIRDFLFAPYAIVDAAVSALD